MPGVGGAGRQPERCDHRQPERQERRKRGRRIDPPGYDGGKKIRGKKRHVLVDTQGLLLQAIVHAADIQDRDGGVLLMATLFGLHPFLLKLYADGGYQGPQFQGGLRRIMRHVDVEIVKRSDAAQGFTVLPRRWIVERTIAWLNRCRRLAKDWECLNRKALAFLRLASIRLMLRKLCQTSK
jgi:transposase